MPKRSRTPPSSPSGPTGRTFEQRRNRCGRGPKSGPLSHCWSIHRPFCLSLQQLTTVNHDSGRGLAMLLNPLLTFDTGESRESGCVSEPAYSVGHRGGFQRCNRSRSVGCRDCILSRPAACRASICRRCARSATRPPTFVLSRRCGVASLRGGGQSIGASALAPSWSASPGRGCFISASA